MRAYEILDLALLGAQRFVRRSDRDDSAVGQNDFGREDVVGGGAINRNPCTGGIVCNHAPDGGARARGNVGPETKSVRIKKHIQLIEHHSGADADAAIVEIEVVDLAIVTREIDDQSFADRVPDQAGASATRRDGNIFVGRRFDDRARVLRAGGKGNPQRLDLIDRRVSGVKLAGQIVEAHVAAGSADPLLSCGGCHQVGNLSQDRQRDGRWQVNCYDFRPAVSITLKTRIRYNGQEYSSPADLPPDVRLAYEKALREVPLKTKFVINGEQFTNETAMPADVQKLYEDVMGVIENNGEVTIPNGKPEPLLTKQEIAVVALFAGGIVVLVLARLVMG